MKNPEDMQNLCVHKMPAVSCSKCGAQEYCVPHRMPKAACVQCAQQSVKVMVSPTTVTSGGASGTSEILDLEQAKRTIMDLLYKSKEGMVPLQDKYTDKNTLEAFGLKKALFDSAFQALRKKRLVRPDSDGLHLSTEEEAKWREARKKGEPYPPQASGTTATKTSAHPNEQKIQVFTRFNAVMKHLGIEVFLTGGAVANILCKSPRPIKDLDYRTTHFKQTFDHLATEVKRINDALRRQFTGVPFKPLTVDDNNKNVLDGAIDGCEVTLARILNEEDLSTYTLRDCLISEKDLILDKATTFIFRTDDVKKATDLFDLLWSMRHVRMDADTLLRTLEEERSGNYAKRVRSQLSSRGEKAGYYSDSLTTQLSISLGHLLARGMASVLKLLTAHAANSDTVKMLKPDLAALARSFEVPFVEQAQGTRPLVIIQAGNMTGDMFGVSAALTHNPLAHVVLITDGSDRDKSSQLQAFYLESLPSKDAARIHVLHAGTTEEPDKEITTLYSTYSGRQKKALPYSRIHPPLPQALRTPDHQVPLSGATTSTANTWIPQQSNQRMKEQWKVDLQQDSTPGASNRARIERFLNGRGVPSSKRYLALWSRFSGKRGGPHAQHDTSFTGMRQMVHLALAEGYVVLLVGDQAKNPSKFDAIAATGRGRVINMVEFWSEGDWKKLFPSAGRQAQLLLFEYLAQTAELKHLGSRSGNLEAFVLIGHQVRYMEEAGNLQASRMEAWHSNQKGAIGYDRILLEDRVPSLTGQWVTEDADFNKSESKPPWVEFPLEMHKESYVPGPLYSIRKEWDWKRFRAQERGFTLKDLKKIHDYLKDKKFEDPESASGLPTWLLELYRRHEDYQAKGWTLGLADLDLPLQRGLHAFTAEPNALLPPWMGKLLAAVHETPPEPEPEPKVPVSASDGAQKPPQKGGRGKKKDTNAKPPTDTPPPTTTTPSSTAPQGGTPIVRQARTQLQMEALALATRVPPGRRVRFRYLNKGSVQGAVNVDCIGVVQSIANLGTPPPSGLGGLLTNLQEGTAVVSASAWPDDAPDARSTVQMPHVVVKAVQLLDGDTGKSLEPGPHVPDVRNDYFTLREKEFIGK